MHVCVKFHSLDHQLNSAKLGSYQRKRKREKGENNLDLTRQNNNDDKKKIKEKKK